MSNVTPFNYELDKITEREVVYDFLSRLKLGRVFINQDYDSASNNNDKQSILPAGMEFKDGVLMNMIRTMDISDILHLDSIKTAYKTVKAGDISVSIEIPSDCTLYRIIQEKTGQDVTECFYKSSGAYKTDFDVPATAEDNYKAYFYTT